jgi:hypothetical protein
VSKRREPNIHCGVGASSHPRRTESLVIPLGKPQNLQKKILFALGEKTLKICSRLCYLYENPRAQGKCKIAPSLARGVKQFAEVSDIGC